MSNIYTDGPEQPDTSKESPQPYTPNPSVAPDTADTSTGVPNRTEYTDGPEPTQAEQ